MSNIPKSQKKNSSKKQPNKQYQAMLPGMEIDPLDQDHEVKTQNDEVKTTQPPEEPDGVIIAEAKELISIEPKTDESSTKTEQPNLKDKLMYVVDAHSLIYQVYHAIAEMTSPTGQSVNAVYGFTRDILNILEQKQPDYLLCAFDLPGTTFRNDLYDQYKANRSAMPEDLRPQFPMIKQILEAMKIPVLTVTNYEADDVLASVAKLADQQQAECYIVSGDKDCRQLITENVKIYNIRKNLVYDKESLQEDWGVAPNQVVDFQSLVGDSVDNVPGVALIGPKIAKELLERFGTLEAIFENIEQISGKKRKENLQNGQESAYLSRQLVKLVDDLPLEINWQKSHVGDMDHQRLVSLFQEFGFRSFLTKFEQLDSREAPKQWETDYKTIDTPEALATLVAQLKQQTVISVDTETTSVQPREAKIVGISFAWEPAVAYYLPIRAPSGDTVLDEQQTLAALAPILKDPNIEKIGQNLKYDMVVFRTAGIEMSGIHFDTMLASYLLDAGLRNHNLDELAKRYLNHTTTKISELIGSGKNQKRMDEVPVDQVSPYAAEDADVPLRLFPILEKRLQEEGLDELNQSLEIPLIETLAELEFNGIKLDCELLNGMSQDFELRIEKLQTKVFELAGHEFNVASPKQLQKVLFEEQLLPVIKKTKTGPSTDASVLEELAKQHPLPATIIEFRQLSKLKSTYIDALPKLIHPETGRVHASFNQVVAATGRLSSSNPNLQNIPIRSTDGRAIRRAFLPGEKDYLLLAADYSQIELRVLAHFCEDETLCQAFRNDEDIHARVAAEINNVELDQVTKEMRHGAKAVNFGVIYGQSPFGLAKSLDIEQDQAADFIDRYFARYPGVDSFMKEVLIQASRKKYVQTILNRRRAISGVRSAEIFEENVKSSSGVLPLRRLNLPERTAINTVIQGSAADLIKMAMINIHRRLKQDPLPARMLLQIHDELVFEVHQQSVKPLAQLVIEEMTNVLQLKVPLKVDVKYGENWADCQPLEF